MNLSKSIFLQFSWLLFCLPSIVAQEITSIDTIESQKKIDKQKSPSAIKILFQGKPGKALKYSLILPGAGQVYNKKSWKVPIVYTALGGTAYGIYFCKKEYNRFDNAYKMRLELKDASTDEFKGRLDLYGIYTYRNYYDYYYQFWSVMLGITYLLNGIEAFVDRHLQEFNVSDDLSLKIAPAFNTQYAGIGLHLVMK